MLSPGKYHLHVPRSMRENLLYRRKVLASTHKDKLARKAVMKMCTEDIAFWVNVFVWQYNPNTTIGKEVGPFILWEFQEEAVRTLLECIEQRQDVAIIKSREMGASWLCLIVMEWLRRFHKDKKFLLISRNAAAVDLADEPDCLMWKVDFINQWQPDWMTKKWYDRRKMGIVNVPFNSHVNGQASTGAAGVGGRATAAFIDEFSRIREDKEVWAGTADTSGCRIFNFTHMGTDTQAYVLSKSGVRKIIMHWSQHPEKRKGLYRYNVETNKIEIIDKSFEYPEGFNFVMDQRPLGGPFPGLRSPWYDRECERRVDPRDIAMHLDIDAEGSQTQFFNPVLIGQLQRELTLDPVWEGDLQFDKETDKIALMRFGGGPLRMWVDLDGYDRPPEGNYTGGLDIAFGTGHSNSCLSLLDTRRGEKVLEYQNSTISPLDLAPLVVALCKLFKNQDGEGAKIVWEQHGPGIPFGQEVMRLGYRNIYWKKDEFMLGGKESNTPGWYAMEAMKIDLLTSYAQALYRREFVNRSRAALQECLLFRYSKKGSLEHSGAVSGDPSGARQNHGDMVIADALSWFLGKGKGVPSLKKEEETVIKPGSFLWRRQMRAKEKEEDLQWA